MHTHHHPASLLVLFIPETLTGSETLTHKDFLICLQFWELKNVQGIMFILHTKSWSIWSECIIRPNLIRCTGKQAAQVNTSSIDVKNKGRFFHQFSELN